MRRCFELARRAGGWAAPNPLVGAVLVHEGRVIGEGWHRRFGEAHAEVDCISAVAESDKVLIPHSTLYCSLEPCAHWGKQPPCARRIAAEGIRHVVVACGDPFLQVSGRGFEILQAAGVKVERGFLEDEGRWLLRRFLSLQERGRPYIILKWAQSADGYLAPADRSRRQLSNSISQTLVHRWRTEEAAILVGRTTAVTDNPRLTAWLWQGPQPLRILLDPDLRVPGTGHLFDGVGSTWILNREREEALGPLRYIATGGADVLQHLIARLAEARIQSLIVEGGAATLAGFIAAGLWDEARVFTSSVHLGGGIPAPLLTGAVPACEAPLADDLLQVLVPAMSPYAYPPGAPL